jgi:protease I
MTIVSEAHCRSGRILDTSRGAIVLADLQSRAELRGKRVAILVDNGFEEVELAEPKRALAKAGAETFIVSPQAAKVRAWQSHGWGGEYHVDIPLAEARAEDFDALVLPGGVMSPDMLRQNTRACDFVRSVFDAGKPIAAICHGPWTLIDAHVVRGLRMTSYPSLKTDLRNAGADWVDEEVVVDHGLITSRDPHDLPAFNRKLIEEVYEGHHSRENVGAKAR